MMRMLLVNRKGPIWLHVVPPAHNEKNENHLATVTGGGFNGQTTLKICFMDFYFLLMREKLQIPFMFVPLWSPTKVSLYDLWGVLAVG